ncbi:MAG: tRNA (N(6)-L-threonylcarbamoyladenosine(37)-C(2))-methylthiotransferase MtaB [Candidatus Latescibacteria bacterium 4484_107]|nr:MAG: tRNA (N(6)-L-threonylcarbamoyladenosine(37)-C(2))-methylthiotransferase MtaB [Candidatus Latescibacteria bacterium 4484_107]
MSNATVAQNKTVSFYTLGCKLNQYETEGMREAFRKRGVRIVPFGEPSNICVVHTCTVTQRTDYQCRQALRRAAQVCKDGLVVATGCYAQTDPNRLAEIEGVGFVVGTGGKTELPDLVSHVLDGGPKIVVGPRDELRRFAEWDVRGLSGHTRALLKIQDGCDQFCSYCIVPFARGPSRSRPLENILREAKRLVEAGYREIVLTGVHIAKYGLDLSPSLNLLDILERLEHLEGLERFRLSSIACPDFSKAWIDFIARSKRVCRHVHLSLQSGDDEILRRMNRRVGADARHEVISLLHERVPGIALGADVIAGFPGESDAQFERTRCLIEELPLSYLHVFPFSKRPGTKAAGMKNQVPEKVKKERAAVLRKIGETKRLAFAEQFVGQTLPVLFEGRRDRKTGLLTGLSDNYIRIMAEGGDAWMGRIVDVRLKGAVNGRMRGRIKGAA